MACKVKNRCKIIYNTSKRKVFRVETEIKKHQCNGTFRGMFFTPTPTAVFPSTSFVSARERKRKAAYARQNVRLFPGNLLQLLRCDMGCTGASVVMEKNHCFCVQNRFFPSVVFPRISRCCTIETLIQCFCGVQ